MPGRKAKRITAIKKSILEAQERQTSIKGSLVCMNVDGAKDKDIKAAQKHLNIVQKYIKTKEAKLKKVQNKNEKSIKRTLSRKEKISRTEYHLIIIKDGRAIDKKLPLKQFKKVKHPRGVLLLQTQEGQSKVIDFDGHIAKNSDPSILFESKHGRALGDLKLISESKSSIESYSKLINLAGGFAGLAFSSCSIWLIKMYVLGGLQ